jgi:hypothetical protein
MCTKTSYSVHPQLTINNLFSEKSPCFNDLANRDAFQHCPVDSQSFTWKYCLTFYFRKLWPYFVGDAHFRWVSTYNFLLGFESKLFFIQDAKKSKFQVCNDVCLLEIMSELFVQLQSSSFPSSSSVENV